MQRVKNISVDAENRFNKIQQFIIRTLSKIDMKGNFLTR